MNDTEKKMLVWKVLLEITSSGMSYVSIVDKLENLFDMGVKEGSTLNVINVVLSRENGIVGATINPKIAQDLLSKQVNSEEYQGGKPSVYIKQITLQ